MAALRLGVPPMGEYWLSLTPLGDVSAITPMAASRATAEDGMSGHPAAQRCHQEVVHR